MGAGLGDVAGDWRPLWLGSVAAEFELRNRLGLASQGNILQGWMRFRPAARPLYVRRDEPL